MGDCCGRDDYQATFSDRFARQMARRFRTRGLTRVEERLVGFLTERGIEGATVLEIGGGVGEIQIELLRRGAASATNLEISTNYEDEARLLLEHSGLTGRVSRRFLDIATAPDDVEPADLVVLHAWCAVTRITNGCSRLQVVIPGGCWSFPTHRATG